LWVIAQDWLRDLPDRPERTLAIERLAEAADLACEALTAAT
jgi:hypothetical protein